MPPSLAEFQEAFGRSLNTGAPLGEGRNALTRAITIHRNTAMRAAQDALAANYPVVQALFGETAFEGCAATFVAAEPPRESRLNSYGAGFPRFLETYRPAMTVPYFSEVARLERLHNEALFARDAEALSGVAAAARMGLEQKLSLHPATRYTSFQSPTVSIWSAHKQGTPLDDILWRPEMALVTRPGAEVLVHILPKGAREFLDACAQGRPIAEAALAANNAGADLVDVFRLLIEAGAFQSDSNGRRT